MFHNVINKKSRDSMPFLMLIWHSKYLTHPVKSDASEGDKTSLPGVSRKAVETSRCWWRLLFPSLYNRWYVGRVDMRQLPPTALKSAVDWIV
jgi:hypothetical protein